MTQFPKSTHIGNFTSDEKTRATHLILNFPADCQLVVKTLLKCSVFDASKFRNWRRHSYLIINVAHVWLAFTSSWPPHFLLLSQFLNETSDIYKKPTWNFAHSDVINIKHSQKLRCNGYWCVNRLNKTHHRVVSNIPADLILRVSFRIFRNFQTF